MLVKVRCTLVVYEMSAKRKYELKQRAAEMAETRRRITEAAVELHGTLGPARTTVSLVAERAGVQRHTVYRHFPSEEELYGACSAHFYEANPLPDPAPWRAIRDSGARLERALDEIYAYYERTEAMLANVLRDFDFVGALPSATTPLRRCLDEAANTLTSGWGARGRQRRLLRAAVVHVLEFQTWRSLTAKGRLTRPEAVELATRLVAAAAARGGSVARF